MIQRPVDVISDKYARDYLKELDDDGKITSFKATLEVIKNDFPAGGTTRLKIPQKYQPKISNVLNNDDVRRYIDLAVREYENLLISHPTELLRKVTNFEIIIGRDQINRKIIGDDGVVSDSLSSRIVEAMGYQTIRDEVLPKYVRKLGIKTCVYCNANYAVTDADGNGYFDMDHWKPKALYPYLCISFFNFQPSCPSCNRRKSDSDEPFFGLWNDRPVTDLDVLDFELSDLSRIMYLVFGNKDVLDVKLVPSNPADPNNLKLCNVANSVFHINSRYKEHNDVTEEIVWKSWIYSPAYLYSLRNAFSHGILSYIDVGRFILGNYIAPDDIHQRPLSRMTQAVARQLGII